MTTILIIEDERTLREDISEILKFEDFETLQAENGLIGVQVARQYRPDLIICDVMMPELDGYGVLMELQSSAPTSKIPFIFLTAKTGRSDMRRGMELGADDYLTKPFTQQELIASVKTRLTKHVQTQQEHETKLENLRSNVIRALPHELRTPLTGIIGYARMIIEDSQAPPEYIEQMATGIDKSARRLHHLIENYLLYAQIELLESSSERVNQAQQQVTTDAALIIHDQAVFKAQEYRRSNDLTCDCEGDYAVQISVDSLEKIANELIDNAFKFSNKATPVHILIQADEQHLTFQIQNQGRGITAEQTELIGAYMQFERQIYEQSGLGLGLIIAKRLTELHQGRFEIQSIPDETTTVTVILPLHLKPQ